ncbi:MAG: transcriptional regulator [Cuniculiplasma divulgatum]|nr:MAG: transcriptional regulator [Cuniculiplasma divulgatum]
MRLYSSMDASRDNSQSERNNKLEELNTILNEPALKATARLSILITLALNTKLTFTELLTITSIGKGSLSNHIEKLESNGLVNVRTVLRSSGPRVIVEITEKGMAAYRKYSEILRYLI